ncbi:S9 family peptidase [Rubrivirga sp. S365]|uniref:S9 family peptidase n=1 Tax=Rubrivirga litoralis TaxID=3075598 RepID=A0ABU3BNM2_9BACT|nr:MULTISPECIES: S9 family peptidase [unclassified Rubrivirga]MDT0630863.1 S9 family peptidase [Rubrivirga sp. F394]MDT7857415.1 S9 family peptidase [Rubrivirga sp. S365]
MKRTLPLLSLWVLVLSPGVARAQVAGGESGYDAGIEAVEPTDEQVAVGLAGADPADIGRYLIAESGAARGAQLSPDGSTLAFLWAVTGEPQLWIQPATGGQPQRLTYGSGVTFFRWAPGGQALLYGADDDGDEQEAYFVVRASGADERRALPAVSGGFRAFGDFVSADRVAYASTERNGLDFDLYVADLSDGEARLVREGRFGMFVRSVSPDGQYAVVAETVGEDSDNLYLLDLATGGLDTLSAPDRRASHAGGGIAWDPDGSGFYLATNRDRDVAALTFYRLGEGFETVEAPAGDVEGVHLCGRGGRYLAWTVNDGGYSRLQVRDREGGAALDMPDLPEGVYGLDCGTGSPRLAVTVSGWRTPGDVVVWDLGTGDVHRPFRSDLAGLDPSRLVRPESVTMPARDGVQLQGLLYLPDATSRAAAGTDDGPPPVVFFVHGGPTSQSRPGFDPVVQYHVDRGLAVFEPNVRGSSGFGHTYVTLDDQERRLDSVRDLVDMLEWLGDAGLVDADRAAVVGGSYGGYAVNAVLAAYPGHFVAGASLYGVADWVTALDVASPALKASDRIEYGDISEPRWRAFYGENSPVRQADGIDVPVLYSHGARDPRIDIAETETMVRSLRSRGVEAPFVRFLDEGHGWRKLSNRLFYYRYQAAFLEGVLVGAE